MPSEPQPVAERTTTAVLRIGVVMVGVGVLATVITLLPLALDADPLPVVAYLLCFLAPLGLGLVLVGLWLRACSRRAHLAASSPPHE